MLDDDAFDDGKPKTPALGLGGGGGPGQGRGAGQRLFPQERGPPPGRAPRRYLASMLDDDAFDDGKPKTRALGLGGGVGLEEPAAHLGSNARPIVTDAKYELV